MNNRYGWARWAGAAAVARTAEEMAAPGLLFAVVAAHESSSAGAFAAASLAVASALAGPLMGAILDSARSSIHVTAGAMVWMASWLAIAAAASSGPVLLVAGVAFLAGLAGPALTGGWTAQLAEVVHPSALARVTAVDAATYNVAGIAGPALAGVLSSSFGARFGVVGAAVALLAAVPAALTVHTRQRPLVGVAGHGGLFRAWPGAGALWRDMARAAAQLVQNRALRYVTVVSTTGYAGLGAALVAAQLLGVEYGGGVGSGGLLIAVFAAGGLAGTALMAVWPARWRLEFAATGSAFVVGLGFIAMSMSMGLAGVGILFAVAGIADGVLLSATLAVRQREASAGSRAQLFTTAASLKIAAYAAGLAVAGALMTNGRTAAFVAGAAHLAAVGVGALTVCRGGRLRSHHATAV